MKATVFALFAACASALSVPLQKDEVLKPRQSCENSATSRDCWGDYSIDTNYYEEWPTTGVTREYWLNVESTTCAPDGFERTCMTFNGTVPGPAIIADWGDELVIHVTNNLPDNGTSIHWHGLRQKGSVEMDGVPGVTECPIAPGQSLTYRFQVTQYGSTWYHSHFTLQYAEGLFGPLIINGPATANYDEDLGALFLSDWSHIEAFARWPTTRLGAPPSLESGLINGTNTYDCSTSEDDSCVGGGKKFETVFEAGKKYRLRLVNVAIDGHFQFSIDGHTLTVIAHDLVPIVPYETDSVIIAIGQRYDVIVEASADAGDYWLRAGWTTACARNSDPDNMTGIVRYDSSSTADPTTTSTVEVNTSCGDEDASNLVPHLALDVTNIADFTVEGLGFAFTSYFQWTINASSLYLDWANPTVLQVINNETIFPTEYNVVSIEKTTTEEKEWAVLVIQDNTGFGLSHPIHLHGHDFWVIAQEVGTFDANSTVLNLTNPPRRDVATLPGNGFIAMAFEKDNPGAWIVHCHIAWHASGGLAMEFVESQSEINGQLADINAFTEQCASWSDYEAVMPHEQDDSGI